MNKNTPYGIVGDGRMARHFSNYLGLSGIPVKKWSRRDNGNIEPDVFLNGCRAVFLLIKDDAILPFAEKYPDLLKMNLFHFSGSLYIEEIPSIHPLMTFTDQLYPLEKYESITFVHEKGKTSFKELFPNLPNRSEALDYRDKSLYHALCVLSGNFTTMLWQKTFTDFGEKLNLDPEILRPYMEQTFENLKNDWQNALTGPLARKDSHTINRNIESLTGDDYQNVYRAFAQTVMQKETI